MKKPGIIERAKLSLRVFNQGLPHKAAPYIFPSYRTGQPQWGMCDFGSYVTEGFDQNSLIYEAIMYKARSVLQTGAQAVYPLDDDKYEVAELEHPLNQLINRPNLHQSWTEFQSLQEVYLNIAGNAYVLFDRPSVSGPPVAMYTMRPDRVWIVPKNTKELLGYIYVPEGKSLEEGTPLLPQDVSHVKFPNPGDPLEGMGYGQSPMAALSLSGDVDNALTSFINQYFESGTMVSTYITFKEAMDETILANAKERFMDIYGGSSNWNQVGVFDSGGEVKRFGMTFNEMNFKELDERNEARIIGPFGVPLTLIASRLGMSGATYNNKQSDREMFWEDIMIPELKMFEVDYRYYLVYDDGAIIRLKYEHVPALQKKLTQRVIDWRGLVEFGVTKNEAARLVGLPLENLPDGDVIYLQAGLIPMGVAPGGGASPIAIQPPPSAIEEEEPETETEPIEEEPKLLLGGNGRSSKQGEALPVEDEDPRSLPIGIIPAEGIRGIWNRYEQIKVAALPEFRRLTNECLKINREELQSALTEERREALNRKGTPSLSMFILMAVNYLTGRSTAMWDAKFNQAFIELVTATGMVSAGLLKETIGASELAAVVQASKWLADYKMVFAQAVNKTTMNDIKFLVNEAINRGSSIREVSTQLDAVFDVWMFNASPDDPDWKWFLDRKPTYRRNLIARDQILKASNSGKNQLHKAWGVKQRAWIATADNRVRESHLWAHGQIVDVDTPFTLGSGHKVMHPGDGSFGAPLGEIIQCRCVEIPTQTTRGVITGVGAEAIGLGT